MIKNGYLKGVSVARTIATNEGQIQVREMRLCMPYKRNGVCSDEGCDELIASYFGDINDQILHDIIANQTPISFFLSFAVTQRDGKDWNRIKVSGIRVEV